MLPLDETQKEIAASQGVEGRPAEAAAMSSLRCQIVESGEGTAANTTITVEGRSGATGNASAVPFLCAEKGNSEFVEIEPTGIEISIGGDSGAIKYYLIKVTANMLALKECDRVVLKTTEVAGSTVPGAIYAISDKPRFSV